MRRNIPLQVRPPTQRFASGRVNNIDRIVGEMVSQGCLLPLMSLLSSPKVEVQKEGCMAIECFAKVKSEDFFHNNADVTLVVLMCRVLPSFPDILALRMILIRGVGPMLTLFESPSEEVLMACARAIGNLAHNGKPVGPLRASLRPHS